MRRSTVLGAVLVSAFCASAIVFGCAIEDDVRYGPHSGVRYRNLPSAAAGEGGAPPTNTRCAEKAPGGGAGAEGGAGDGGAPSACTVKFNADIWPKMQNAWGCVSASCHGSTSGAPQIGTTVPPTAAESYDFLRGYKVGGANGKPYIDCSGDPTTSGFSCNVQMIDGAAGCGTAVMSPPSGISAADLASLDAWLSCGAPFN